MTDRRPGSPSDYIYGIDLIRFTCAAMVMLFHLGLASWASPLAEHPGFKIQSLEKIAQPGWVGVEIFFVISGFVVAGAASAASPSGFVKGRILRLYPAVWVCATLTVLTRLFDGASIHVLYPYVMSLVLSPRGPWIDGQYWTLATEISFYSLIFLLIVSRLVAHIGALAIVLTLLSAILVLALQIHPGAALLLNISNLRYLPVYNGADFALGIFIWLGSRGRLSRLAICGTIISFVIGGLQIHQGNVYDDARIHAATGTHFSALVPISVWLLAAGLIVLSIRFKQRFNALPERARSVIRTLGLMTYPVYLLHFTIGVVGMSIMTKRGVSPIAAMLIMMTIICAISLLICTQLEPPLKRRLRAFLDRIEVRFGWSLPSAEAGTG